MAIEPGHTDSPDRQHPIQGGRRRILRRIRLGAGLVAVVAGVAVAVVNPSVVTTIARLSWSAESGNPTAQPVLAPATADPTRPITTSPPIADPSTTQSSAATTAIEAHASTPTAILIEPSSGAGPRMGSGLGMPDGGGTVVGSGVTVSLTGRYGFSMVCTGGWQGHAIQVSLAPLAAHPGDGSVAGTFDCRGEQQEVNVSVDGPTTKSLQRSGTMILMTFTVVQQTSSGYMGIGPTLSGMSVALGNIRSEGAAKRSASTQEWAQRGQVIAAGLRQANQETQGVYLSMPIDITRDGQYTLRFLVPSSFHLRLPTPGPSAPGSGTRPPGFLFPDDVDFGADVNGPVSLEKSADGKVYFIAPLRVRGCRSPYLQFSVWTY